jgi:hypothetical protein
MDNKLPRYWKYLALSGFGLFLVAVIIVNIQPFCDETYYLENVTLFLQYGFSDTFFIKYLGPAGPTFAWVHYLFYPFTHLETIPTRIVNMLLTGIVLWIYMRLIRKTMGESSAYGWLNMLIVPTTYVATGFAITQMPSLLFLLSGIYFIYVLLNEELPAGRNILYNFLVMVCFTLAILGRQTYMIFLLSIFVYALMVCSFNIGKMIVKAYGLALCLIPLGYIFWIWKGIQPPITQFVQSGWRVDHILYAFGYAGIFVLLIAPDFFYRPRTLKSILLALLGFIVLYVLNLSLNFAMKTSLTNLVNRFMNETMLHHWSIFTSTVLLSFSIYFGGSLLYRMYLNRHDHWYLFLGLSAMLIFGTCIKITHQFSALYPYQVMPLLLMLIIPYDRIDKWKLLRSAALIGLGFLNYFFYV